MTAELPNLRRVDPAWFNASISQFLELSDESIIGALTANGPHAVEQPQVAAWKSEISVLKHALNLLSGHVFLEFDIPRMGRRIDAVVISGAVIFAIEFKVGSATFDRAAIEQVWDYALDLKNFHGGSLDAPIVPILIATEAASSPVEPIRRAADGVFHPILVCAADLRKLIDARVEEPNGALVDPVAWHRSRYQPTPTIIEAAKALYSRHSVEEIARNDAGAINLRLTSKRVEDLIDLARRDSRKMILFITGVPGAGKTLVGLNVATSRRDRESPTHAVFLSGNGPLVAVLVAALTRDAKARKKRTPGEKGTSQKANAVKAFIQNVHHFRDAALQDLKAPPFEHVAIFDEAQRAWNAAKTADFMKKRKNQPNFTDSEPAWLIRYMDRHKDWAVIVCLVGGGQEIHTGEAGIREWLESAAQHFSDWELYVSSRLTDSEYAAGGALEIAKNSQREILDDSLHLSVSMRSFRAENVSAFVKSVLDFEVARARSLLKEIDHRFPIRVTRDLEAAKNWVRERARGSERFGMLASSKALRRKPHAIDVRTEIDPVHWFLDDCEDTRSSYYLEDCATEFQVQGLELDWTILNWDADLRCVGGSWAYHAFKGKKWQNIRSEDRRLYLKNAYRVLMTRARQGMVIFVPPGEEKDPTRPPYFYEETYRYLKSVGILSL